MYKNKVPKVLVTCKYLQYLSSFGPTSTLSTYKYFCFWYLQILSVLNLETTQKIDRDMGLTLLALILFIIEISSFNQIFSVPALSMIL